MQDNQAKSMGDARLGRVLRGKYRLDRVLGTGGMATVYAATHRNSKQFAVKMLHAELSTYEAVRTRFLREGYLANQVKHPGAVTVLDEDVAEDGSAFVVMELLDGAFLDEVCRENEGRLPLSVVLSLGDAILDVLVAAHARGIVHRDLKPANFFLTSDGALKVLDFGIASLRDDAESNMTLSGLMIGTPAFMAPEQALAKKGEVGPQADLWAVGATLFTMLAGKLVHEGENAPQLLVCAATQQARAIASVTQDVPEPIAAVIDRALAFEKKDRWPSASMMREALAKACLEATGEAIGPLPKQPRIARSDSGLGAPREEGSGGAKSGERALHATVPASKRAGKSARGAPSWRVPAPSDAPEAASKEDLLVPLTRSAAGAPSSSKAAPKEDVLVPLTRSTAGTVEPATHLRSTMIAASVLTLRSKGYFERYLGNLPESFHEAVLHSVPGTWVPLEVGVAHYRAADALGLTATQQFEMGQGVAERVQKGFLGTLVRMAKGAGVTPWTGLEYLPKLWERAILGGAVAVYRLGPKEARVECYGAPDLAELSYFRNGYRGMFASSGELFCSKVYIHDLPAFTMRKLIGFRVAWA